MSKTVLTKVDGFTPLPDLLVTKYGRETAAVWGSAWRYCQMSDGVCRASIEKIGNRIGLSRQSTMKHMNILVNDGFFEDTTPDLKNKPHIYKDTGKVSMYNRFGIGVKQIDSGVNLVDSDCQVALHEDSIKDTQDNIPPETRKPDLVDGIIELSQMPGVKKSIRLDAIASQIGQRLHINPSSKKWDDFLRFVDDRQQKDGQDFERFLDWLTAQKNFDVSFWPPTKMMEHWPRAFAVPKKTYAEQLEEAGYA